MPVRTIASLSLPARATRVVPLERGREMTGMRLGGRRSVGSSWYARRWRWLVGPLAAGLVVALAPAVVAGAHPAPHPGGPGNGSLQVVAPAETARGSVVLIGTTRPDSTVRVDGGVVPATVAAGADGTFAVEVLLRPDRRNHLTVSAFSAGGRSARRVVVAQRLGRATGQVTRPARRAAAPARCPN
jgi:hypothetical protein